MRKRLAVLGLVAFVLLGRAMAAGPRPITVLSAGAVEPGLRAAAAAFEKRTGHVVKISFATAPQIPRRRNRTVTPPAAAARRDVEQTKSV